MYTATLIPGDGIGPEVTYATKDVIEASGVNINWDIVEAGQSMMEEHKTPLPQSVLDSIKKNKVALKGPLTTPIGTGFKSINVALRKEFDLYANVRPIRSIEGFPSRFGNLDMVIVRENTEDLYAGIEYMINPDIAQSIKVITRKGCERIFRFAFEFARKEGRKKITAVHKANIMKMSDGLFISVGKEMAKEYPDIEYAEEIVDALCMNLVMYPQKYDMLVLTNLYGDIVSDLCAGLVGGLGLVPGANIGELGAIFEPVHGTAPVIAGQNIANPTASILSGCMMLQYLGESDAAVKIESAVHSVIQKGKVLTRDLHGSATTTEFAQEVIRQLKSFSK